jgi:hypothetical protein
MLRGAPHDLLADSGFRQRGTVFTRIVGGVKQDLRF